MTPNYITKIDLVRLRNTPQCSIQLPTDRRTHLIITGPNGCGKTTFINALINSLMLRPVYLGDVLGLAKTQNVTSWHDAEQLIASQRDEHRVSGFARYITSSTNKQEVIPDIAQKREFYIARELHSFLVYKSEAHRKGNFNTPSGPKRLPTISTGEQFVQQLVNMKTQQAYVYQDMNTAVDSKERADAQNAYKEIQQWFGNLHGALARLFGHDNFKLDFDRKTYNYTVDEHGKEPYQFTQLSDGYSAILKIVTDLMLQMSTNPLMTYASPGIAIIDEIETHLHVELQQKILPFLSDFFPNIQFIVTTHSPFVLSSISNAVIFDMKSHQQYQDFSQYSYSNLIEGYFNVSQYSNVITEQIERAEQILAKGDITHDDIQFIRELDTQITKVPDFQPLALKNRWLSLKLKYINIFNGNI